jgi:selenocysteine lyase/cysteine desulfurase
MYDRRRFLAGGGSAISGLALLPRWKVAEILSAAPNVAGMSAKTIAGYEPYWAALRKGFTPDPQHIWFNCFANNPPPSSVQARFVENDDLANAWPMANLRKVFGSDKEEALRTRLASRVNASADEIALTRNTTEALSNVIFGLDLAPGDEVVVTDQDYGTFLDAWAQRERRDGIVVRRISTPKPAQTSDDLVRCFRDALSPRTRVVMFSHISAVTGQIFPARAIADFAHNAGSQVIVDGALSFGVIPVDVRKLDCDYFGTSLHKGIFAPTGTGFLYVRRERIHALWPLFGSPEAEADNIRKLEHRGTAPVSALATVTDALDFHEEIGTERLAARYRYLKQAWAERIASHPQCRFLVSLEPEHSCGITLLTIEGVDPVKARKYLYEKRAISVWPTRPWHQAPIGLWVSPYPFTSQVELEALVAGLEEIVKAPNLS